MGRGACLKGLRDRADTGGKEPDGTPKPLEPEIRRYAIIPARGNSKGIARKNLYPVAGRPLLFYTVSAALETGLFDQVVVSSESDEVLAYAASLGATPRVRPAHLSQDHVHSVHVVLDLIVAMAMDPDSVVAMLLPTSPLRPSADIAGAVRAFEGGAADSLVSVYRDTKHLLNLRRIGAGGLLERVVEGDPNVQRQELDELYVVNGSIYVSRAANLLERQSFHLGTVMPFVMGRRVSIDVNTLDDVEDVERALLA